MPTKPAPLSAEFDTLLRRYEEECRDTAGAHLEYVASYACRAEGTATTDDAIEYAKRAAFELDCARLQLAAAAYWAEWRRTGREPAHAPAGSWLVRRARRNA